MAPAVALALASWLCLSPLAAQAQAQRTGTASSTAPAAAAPAETISPEAAEIQRLIKDGQHSQALKLIDASLAQQPKSPQMLFRRGVVLSLLDRRTEALTVFQKLVDEHPDMPAPYNNIAVIQGSMGDYDKARATLEKAIRTNPAYATAYQNLGDVYAQLASQAYNKALQLDKADATVPPKLALLRELSAAAPQPVADTTVAKKPSAAPTQVAVVTPAPATTPATKLPTVLPPVNRPSAPAAVTTASATTASVTPPATPTAAKPASPAGSHGSHGSPSSAPASGPQTASPTAVVAAAPAKPAVTAAIVSAAASTPPARPAPSANTPAGSPAAAAGSRPGSDNSRTEVEAAVQAWAQAWSRRDMAAYYSAYTPDFAGQSGSHKAWEKDRHDRIATRRQIKVEVSELKVTVDGDRATARFRQAYSSDTLSTSSRKTLELVRLNGGKWVIRQESTGG